MKILIRVAVSISLALAGCDAADGSRATGGEDGRTVVARVTGVVVSTSVPIGAYVERGQLLAEIRAPELVRVRQAVDLERSRLDLVLSRQLRDLAQLRRFDELGFGSRAVVESLDAEVARTQSRIARLERIRRETADRLAGREVRAPLAGCVLASSIEAGDPVREGETLYRLEPDVTVASGAAIAVPHPTPRGAAGGPDRDAPQRRPACRFAEVQDVRL